MKKTVICKAPVDTIPYKMGDIYMIYDAEIQDGKVVKLYEARAYAKTIEEAREKLNRIRNGEDVD